MRTSPPRRRWWPSHCAIDFNAGPSEIVVVSTTGRAAWIAADLIAQAEHDPDARAILLTPSRRLARCGGPGAGGADALRGPAAPGVVANGGIVLTRSIDEAIALCERMAPEHVVCDTDAVARRLTRAGTVFVGDFSAQASGDYATGSNHVLPTSGAAGARGGLSAADFVRVSTVQRLSAIGHAAHRACRRRAGESRGAGGPRRLDPDAPGLCPHSPAPGDRRRAPAAGIRARERSAMSYEYERVSTPLSGLRLHLNENTAGCSPAVVEALGAMSRHDLATYPDYDAAIAATAAPCVSSQPHWSSPTAWTRAFWPPRWWRCAAVRARARSRPSSSCRPSTCTPRAPMQWAATIVDVPLGPGFEFPLEGVIAAITPRTRLVWLTNPNNPTGQSIPRAAIAGIARAAAKAMIFVDEAYVDFWRCDADRRPAVAGASAHCRRTDFRQGLWPGRASSRGGRRRRQHHRVDASRRSTVQLECLRDGRAARCLRRHGILRVVSGTGRGIEDDPLRLPASGVGITHWKSDANFVLARFPAPRRRVAAALAGRGVHVRDRRAIPAAPTASASPPALSITRAHDCGARGGPVRRATDRADHERDADHAAARA